MNYMKGKIKNQKIYISLGLILLVVLYFFADLMFLKPKRVEKQISLIAENLNKECPFIIDISSSLDSVESISAEKIIYYKTLYNQSKGEINFDDVNKYIVPHLLEKTISDKNFNVYRANHLIIDHVFYDRFGSFVNRISITPEMYEGR